MNLLEFIEESNTIEGIEDAMRSEELEAYKDFLAQDEVNVTMLEKFVQVVAGAKLRGFDGMNVGVGNFVPPPGGVDLVFRLEGLLGGINAGDIKPFQAHCVYEKLHPFMDGNGRSGRVLWLWHMAKDKQVDPLDVIYHIGFLHQFYYQSLEAHHAA